MAPNGAIFLLDRLSFRTVKTAGIGRQLRPALQVKRAGAQYNANEQSRDRDETVTVRS